MNSWIHQADAIIIGAGAGLSTAAGLTYDGSYHYISNHIVPDNNNQIPKYTPGITNKSQKEGGCL